MFTGVLVNVILIICGSLLGILLKKCIPEGIRETIMSALALCVVYIGFSGTLKGENTLVLIISVLLGAMTGSLLNIDAKLNRLGNKIEGIFKSKSKISEGFITGTLVYCIGAMAIVGSLNSGFTGDHSILFSKSVLDGISSIFFASTTGIGVALSSISVLIYQGFFVLLSGVLKPILTEGAINEITCTGSLLILAIGLNMLKITKIKVADLLPAIVITPIVYYIFTLF